MRRQQQFSSSLVRDVFVGEKRRCDFNIGVQRSRCCSKTRVVSFDFSERLCTMSYVAYWLVLC